MPRALFGARYRLFTQFGYAPATFAREDDLAVQKSNFVKGLPAMCATEFFFVSEDCADYSSILFFVCHVCLSTVKKILP